MYHFRYYAIGHSYLLHGPFSGWQTEGMWGMAASCPERDYFHQFQDLLKESFECRLEAVAENHATYERRCVEGATKESYTTAPEYAHMKEVLTNFKPNLISLFIGDGNTVAKDAESAALFYDTLYEMIAENKREDALVICVCFRGKILETMRTVAQKYGFLAVDASFIHEQKGIENPYYAYRDYPAYDEQAARGAVEFRTHPNDLGHRTIAERMFDAVAQGIPQRIQEGDLDEPYRFEEYVHKEKLIKFQIRTQPDLFVQFHGFNVRQGEGCVIFGSAPETGASVSVDNLQLPSCYHTFYVELAVDGVKQAETLKVTVTTKQGEQTFFACLPDNEMHRYEFDLSHVTERIRGVRVSPEMRDCVLTVRSLGFLE